MNRFWDTDPEEPVSEYDLVEEAAETEQLAAQYAQEPIVVEADDDEIEQILAESAYSLDQNEANVIYNTRIRLEQARLYEMLINHNLFDGVDADASAITIVQNEIKHYIVKRLEILMGLRQPIIRQNNDLPLNSIELDFLKQLAYKGTRGASTQANTEPESPPPPTAFTGLKPIKPTVKSSSLKGLSKNIARTTPPTPQVQNTKTPIQNTKPQPKKKHKSAPQSQRQVRLKNTAAPRELRPEEIEALAKEDLTLMKGRKPFHQMSAKEKAKEIARVNQAHAPKPKPANALPLMNPDQQMMKYMTEQSSRTNRGSQANQFNQIMSHVANQIVVKKSQDEYE